MTDRRTFGLVAAGLIGLGLVAVVGIVLLIALDKQVPDALSFVPAAIVPGLLGLLTRSPADDPQPVEVRQPAGAPVPTVEVAAPRRRTPTPPKEG